MFKRVTNYSVAALLVLSTLGFSRMSAQEDGKPLPPVCAVTGGDPTPICKAVQSHKASPKVVSSAHKARASR